MSQSQVRGKCRQRAAGGVAGRECFVSESGRQASLQIISRISWPELKSAGRQCWFPVTELADRSHPSSVLNAPAV